MIDDLESLLNDVDSKSTFNEAQEGVHQEHLRQARKGDRPVVDSTTEEALLKLEKKISFLLQDPSLRIFTRQYLNAFVIHNDSIGKIRAIINEKSASESVAAELRKYRYSYEKSLGNIEQAYTEFVTNCSEAMLAKKARNDFHLFFGNNEITTERTNFLLVKELFLRIREFNSRFRKDWGDLQKGIGMLNMAPEGRDIYIGCTPIVTEVLDFCGKTDKLIKLFAAMLCISDDDLDILEHELANKIVFFETYDYSLQNIFGEIGSSKSKIADVNDELEWLIDKKPVQELKETHYEKIEKRIVSTKIIKNKNAEIEEQMFVPKFSLRGTSTWNTKEPYIIKLDREILAKNKDDLSNTIYFNEDIPIEMKVAGQIKRAMIHYMRDPQMYVMNQYGEFIQKIVSQKAAELVDFFKISDSDRFLFIYHLAPLTVSRILIDSFELSGQGVCYRILEENKVSRYIPNEFIKENVLQWYDININSLTLPFDRVSEYNEIKRIVNEKYLEEKGKNEYKVSKAVEKYVAQTGKTIDPSVMIKKKAAELFGIDKIPVYNRFIDRTLFK